MLTRREVVLGGAVAGAGMILGAPGNASASASQPSTPVHFQVPEGACDCHVHTFDPQHFPYAAGRPYTPEPVSVGELRALHRALHIDRVIVVQPTVYGTDNAGTLDGMKQLGPRSRGVAVIDEKTPDSALADMDSAGVRGIRINLETAGQTDPYFGRRRFQAAVDQSQGRQMAHPDLHAPIRNRGHERSDCGRADARGVRSFWRGAGGAGNRAARIRNFI